MNRMSYLKTLLPAMSHASSSRLHPLVFLWFLLALPLLVVTSGLLLQGCGAESEPRASAQDRPHVVASNPVEAGRYLVTVGACNDCHTKGYLEKEGDVPEEDWLTGSPVGWKGPWGTTYGSNLRLYADTISADQWVKTLHTRTAMPPMPWMNVNQMSERDARAIYAYLKHLGPKGKAMPKNVPPGQEPHTPYRVMAPQTTGANPPADTSSADRQEQ